MATSVLSASSSSLSSFTFSMHFTAHSVPSLRQVARFTVAKLPLQGATASVPTSYASECCRVREVGCISNQTRER